LIGSFSSERATFFFKRTSFYEIKTFHPFFYFAVSARIEAGFKTILMRYFAKINKLSML